MEQTEAAELVRRAVNAKNAAYRSANPERVRAWNERYRARNSEQFKKSQRDYKRKRYDSDPDYRLLCQLRSRLAKVVERGLGLTQSVRCCGCSLPELRSHLESQFQDGMSWEDRKSWHIDHIFPVSAIDASNRLHVIAVNNWRNLQALPAAHNRSKSGAVTEEARAVFERIVSEIAEMEACRGA